MNNRSNILTILLFCFFGLVAVPSHAQTPDPQYSSDTDNVNSDVLDVVESAFQDLNFLLSLQGSVTGSQPLLQQLKNDYYPLFDESAIAYLTLEKQINHFNSARRDYLSCLLGLRFFNSHLNIVYPHTVVNVQFEVGDVRTSGNSQIRDVDVSYINADASIPMVVRLIKRGDNANWKIIDVLLNDIGILGSFRYEMKDVIGQSFDNRSQAFDTLKNLLYKKNKTGPIGMDQWCKQRKNQPKPNERTNKAQSNEQLEIKTTLNGKPENVHVEVTPTGTIIYQDDIILNTNGDLEAAVSGLDFTNLRLWDNAVVPYLINRSLSQEKQSLILKAIQEYEKKTPVRFTKARSNDENVLMFSTGDGCRSNLGMIGDMQFILLGEQCSYGTVLHEIGHTLGLVHEHNRHMRDDYVNVNLKNVLLGKERNFYKHPSGHPVTDSYCYSSIMHYSEHAFAIARGYKTIEVKGTNKIGQRRQLSSCDVDRVRQLYTPLKKKTGNRPDTDTESVSRSDNQSGNE